MQEFLVLVFLLLTLLIINSYLIYPLLIKSLEMIKKPNYSTDETIQPRVAVLISAFNEEKVIEKTIRNFFNSEYDLSKLEIVVGSDNSKDETNNILKSLSGEYKNLKFFPFEQRRGKQGVLNLLVEKTDAEILIFSDANTIYKPDAIRKLVKFYKDSNVGGVCGRLKLLELEEALESGSQEKIYWDLETWIKDTEGKLGILIGANGGIYSIRRELFKPIPITHPVMDDFYISMKILEQKKDFIYIKDAVAEEHIAPSVKDEFNRKVRNNSMNLFTLQAIKKLMSPAYGLVSYGLWSHKIIRWMTPVILLLLFVINIFILSVHPVFQFTFGVQIIFYIFAFIGLLLKILKIRFTPFLLCYYFVLTNIAMFIGIYRFIFNKQKTFWQSTAR